MINVNENIMLKEAKQAKFKTNVFLQVLIFIGIFLSISLIQGVILAVPEMIWLFTKTDYLNAAIAGNYSSIIELSANPPGWLTLIQLFTTVLETACAVLYCYFLERRSLASIGFIKKGWFKNYIIGYLVGAVMIVSAGLLSVATGSMSIKISTSFSIIYFLLFFIGFLIQGMGEEVLVRGYFMVSVANSLKSKHAAAIAVFISSLFFAMLHLANPGITFLAFINLILAGVFFATYILRTDNIWGACAAHSAWNFFQGNVIGIQVSGLDMSTSIFTAANQGSSTLINGGSFGLEGGLAVTIVQIIAILLLLFLPKKKTA